jgi:hypothetical protein
MIQCAMSKMYRYVTLFLIGLRTNEYIFHPLSTQVLILMT